MTSPSDPTSPIPLCPSCGATLPATGAACPECAATPLRVAPVGDRPSAPTRRIAGYTILKERGSGGMGSVYEAYDEKLRRKVALKVLALHLAPSGRAGLRFEREAWIAGRLDHPNIVKVFDRGEWEGTAFFVMELVDGGSLQEVITRLKGSGKDERRGLAFDTGEYLRWAVAQIVQAAGGLDHAHRHRVIHRDVKPGNLLLARDPEAVKVADFGLAVESDATRLTSTGNILGTLFYMAPEQILGRHHEIGPHTDVYALGVTLFELLTLDLPFSGNTQQTYMSSVLNERPRRAGKLNPRVDRQLETVLEKALEKEPKDRYSSAAAFASDLESVLASRPIVARAPGRVTRASRWARRKPASAALAAALAIGVPTLVALGALTMQQRKALRVAEIEKPWREAYFLYQLSRFEEVIEKATEVLALDPAQARAVRLRALAKVELALGYPPGPSREGLADGALADAGRAVALLPEVSWPHLLRAFVLEKLGRIDDAASEHAVARTLRSTPPSADDLRTDAWRASSSGDLEGSVRLLTEVLVQMPGYADAYSDRGDEYERLGGRGRAIADYRTAAGLNPEDVTYRLRLGRALTLAGDLDEAEQQLREAIRRAPVDALAYEILSQNLLEQGRRAAADAGSSNALSRFQEAEAQARKSLDLDSRAAWALVNLGASLNEQARLPGQEKQRLLTEAVERYEQALGKWPVAPMPGPDREVYLAALINRCDALVQLRRLDQALEACTAVTESDRRSAPAFYNLAAVYALRGDRDAALEALERDLALGDVDSGWLERDEWFESLRTDARFVSVLERMKAAAVAGDAR